MSFRGGAGRRRSPREEEGLGGDELQGHDRNELQGEEVV
jgi:hypothetical protein